MDNCRETKFRPEELAAGNLFLSPKGVLDNGILGVIPDGGQLIIPVWGQDIPIFALLSRNGANFDNRVFLLSPKTPFPG